MMSRHVFQDVQGRVLQQAVANDGKRKLRNEGAVVGVKLLRGGGGRHFGSRSRRVENVWYDLLVSALERAAACREHANAWTIGITQQLAHQTKEELHARGEKNRLILGFKL